MHVMFLKTVIEIIQGDITTQNVDVIVNAAKNSLLGGGGVDGAIHKAGGPTILEQCEKLNGCETGDAKITTGGNLPAKYIIHTVGPIYSDGEHNESVLLHSCYKRSLELASKNKLKSIAFPAISCGIYGYPHKEAAKIAISAAMDYALIHEDITLIRFVLFENEIFETFQSTLKSEQDVLQL